MLTRQVDRQMHLGMVKRALRDHLALANVDAEQARLQIPPGLNDRIRVRPGRDERRDCAGRRADRNRVVFMR